MKKIPAVKGILCLNLGDSLKIFKQIFLNFYSQLIDF